MASSEMTARLQFLKEAAHLLVLPAPATSRHLMLKHNSLLSDHNPETFEGQPNSCGACGTIMVVGWEGRLEVESIGGKRRKRRRGERQEKGKTATKSPSKASKTMLYTCDSCKKTTRFPLDLAAKPARYNPSSQQLQPSKISAAMPSTTTSNVKKRTKSKKGGLAAILAKQKESQANSTGGFGLDLMDFMKKS